MIPSAIARAYAGPVSGILPQELAPLLLGPLGGFLMSRGVYPLLACRDERYSLVQDLDTEVLTFCPQDELVIYGTSIDIWRADDIGYYLLDSLQFAEPVYTLIDNLEYL